MIFGCNKQVCFFKRKQHSLHSFNSSLYGNFITNSHSQMKWRCFLLALLKGRIVFFTIKYLSLQGVFKVLNALRVKVTPMGLDLFWMTNSISKVLAREKNVKIRNLHIQPVCMYGNQLVIFKLYFQKYRNEGYVSFVLKVCSYTYLCFGHFLQ